MTEYKPNIFVRIYHYLSETFGKCYMCRHPYFMHKIGKNYMYCRSFRCECNEQKEYESW